MPSCGSQCILCDLPIRFDTYMGCSHGCKYCFVQLKGNLNKIKKSENVETLKSFIVGKRNSHTSWCDWHIPLHWGGTSDPFQPCEKTYKNSYECLKVFEETQYPFVVSTKGKLITEPEYLQILKKCNCVVQISAVCDKYDKLELGAPTFKERLKMIETLSANVQRVIVRVQPYMHEVFTDVYDNLNKFKDCGVYGVIIEGMKFKRKKNGLVKVGGDFCYPLNIIKKDFMMLKSKAHKIGLKIYAGENRIRKYGDSLTCCGIDGLEGFNPNKFNINHLINGDVCDATEGQKASGTGYCFKAFEQTFQGTHDFKIKKKSFEYKMYEYLSNKRELANQIFGIKQ